MTNIKPFFYEQGYCGRVRYLLHHSLLLGCADGVLPESKGVPPHQ